MTDQNIDILKVLQDIDVTTTSILDEIQEDINQINNLKNLINTLHKKGIKGSNSLNTLNIQEKELRNTQDKVLIFKDNIFINIYLVIYNVLLQLAIYDHKILNKVNRNRVLNLIPYFNGFTNDDNVPEEGHFIKFNENEQPKYTKKNIIELLELFNKGIIGMEEKIIKVNDINDAFKINEENGYSIGDIRSKLDAIIVNINNNINKFKNHLNIDFRGILIKFEEKKNEFNNIINLINKKAVIVDL